MKEQIKPLYRPMTCPKCNCTCWVDLRYFAIFCPYCGYCGKENVK